MRKHQVKVGSVYVAKISGQLTEVRITGENRLGGWTAINLRTNRQIHIKSAAKLRKEVT